jgi:2-iminobutanoate/2-iminopropanoate deaminase
MTKKIILSDAAPAPIGPYSQAVLFGNTLYVSGQIALATFESGASIEEETNQVMKNIGSVLLEAGFVFEDVVKCSIFVKNMNDFGAINGVYATYFSENPPARETVEVARLPKDVRVEISCIAHK